MGVRSGSRGPCVAYADESLRPGYFYLAMLIVPVSTVGHIERTMRELCLPGQTRFHAKSESPRRRRAAISRITSVTEIEVWIYRAPRPATAARSLCVKAAASDLAELNVGQLIIERVEDSQDHRDRLIIAKAQRESGATFAYSHESPSKYAGLQVADVIVWAYGAGADWRARVMPVVTRVRRFVA